MFRSGSTGLPNGLLNGLADQIIEHTSAVIYVKDAAFRYLFVNRKFESLFDVTLSTMCGRTDFDIFPLELAEGFRRNDTWVASHEKPLYCEEIAPHADGIHHYVSVKFPLFDEQGALFAVAGISTDVTEKVHSQRELESLHRQYQIILQSVGDGVCGLDAEGRITFINPAAERMLGYSKEELKGQCRTKIVVERRVCSKTPPIDDVLNGSTETQMSDGAFRQKCGSLLPVEYVASAQKDEGKTIGSVIAFRDVSDRIERLRSENELMAARAVQMALYPKYDPILEGFDISGITHAASLTSGDYYDFIKTADGSLVVAVGDVSGHGLGPALEMVETRASFRTVLFYESDLGKALSQLNRVLANDLPEGMFVTLFAVRLDPVHRTMTYTSAGHQANILFHSDEVSRLDSTGTVLGMFDNAPFETAPTITLRKGDVIVLATDGIMEQGSPLNADGSCELFGWHRTMESVRKNKHLPASEILKHLCNDVKIFARGSDQKDDVTAVIIKAT